MPTWIELINELNRQNKDYRNHWLVEKFNSSLKNISRLRGDKNVICFASAFLQKPTSSPFTIQISSEDINGIMTTIHGMDCSKGLVLILHTPGGVTNAAETIVSYLHAKFKFIEVIIPTYAMSAGTMISLSSNNIIMGKQSQLGPIDPQMPIGGRLASAIAILDQFSRAKNEISRNDSTAHVWAPILSSLGPSLLQDAQNAIEYSEQIVAGWLESRMFENIENSQKKALGVAKHFSRGTENGARKKSHGRRIDRNEAKSQGVVVEDLETNQNLQEAVLTAYHLMTIFFETGPALKIIANQNGKLWVKNSSK